MLPLLGVTMTTSQFVMVSKWMVKGNINEFVKMDIGVDRMELVSFLLKFLILLIIDNQITTVA